MPLFESFDLISLRVVYVSTVTLKKVFVCAIRNRKTYVEQNNEDNGKSKSGSISEVAIELCRLLDHVFSGRVYTKMKVCPKSFVTRSRGIYVCSLGVALSPEIKVYHERPTHVPQGSKTPRHECVLLHLIMRFSVSFVIAFANLK